MEYNILNCRETRLTQGVVTDGNGKIIAGLAPDMSAIRRNLEIEKDGKIFNLQVIVPEMDRADGMEEAISREIERQLNER
jgi:hypothetical protein